MDWNRETYEKDFLKAFKGAVVRKDLSKSQEGDWSRPRKENPKKKFKKLKTTY